MTRIIHLSDIHFNKNYLAESEAYLLEPLKRDLKRFHNENPIDLIVFSGDLIDKAGQSFDNNIDVAFLEFEDKFVNPISECLNIDKSRFFFAPGNHDMKIDEDLEKDESWIDKELSDADKLRTYVKNLETSESKRNLKFHEFINAYYTNTSIEKTITPFESSYKVNNEKLSIGITCFNSSWRCYSSEKKNNYYDKGKLLVSEYQVTRGYKNIKECNLKIAVMHHSFEWIKDFDKENIKKSISKSYDMILFGHGHRPDSEHINSANGSVFVSFAPSNWGGNNNSLADFINGYSIIDYDKNEKKIVQHHRKYSKNKNEYVPNNDLGDDLGMSFYSFPTTDEIKKGEVYNQCLKRISDIFYPQMDEKIITHLIETKAPKTIDEIFVEPKLIMKGKINSEGESKDQEYTIEEIVSCEKDNFIFCGIDESGKTMLLNRILKTVCKNINKNDIIPIYIDFKNIGSKSIENIVNGITGLGKKEIYSYTESHTIILLLDNISFKKDDLLIVEKIEDFVCKCKNIRVFATKNQTVTGVDINFLEYSGLFTSFKLIDLEAFGTKQTKQLIKKWFNKSETFNTDSHFKKILDVIIKLRIPMTPLSISMFLWILEQQEDFEPLNHATMLESFIEKTFEKSSSENHLSKTFDYNNKVRLLSSISHFMFQKNNANYCVKYNDLLSFTLQYLSKKGFDFQADILIKEFILRGILYEVKDNNENNENIIKFRFGSFFKYFLMKHMDYDNDFMDFVFKDDNYFMFVDEIDYYTALKRDQEKILIKILDDMSSIYSTLISDIEKVPGGFDTFFETEKSVVERTDSKKLTSSIVASKPTEEQIDQINDKILSSITPDTSIENKKQEISPLKKMETIMVLAAKILKNTEETKERDIKDQGLKQVIKCSMAFACLYKVLLDEKIKEKKEKEEKVENRLLVLKNILPIMHQIMMKDYMGTEKLSVILKDKLEMDLDSESVADFEKFITLFLYSDIKGVGYTKYIEIFIEKIRKNYIYDMTLFKVVLYYYFRSKNKYSNLEYEKMISSISVKANKYKKKDRGEVIDKYRKRKKSYVFKDDTI